jgi:hypothetical protein
MVSAIKKIFHFTILLANQPACYASPSFLGDSNAAATSFDGGLRS